jgi:hypothetical protein
LDYVVAGFGIGAILALIGFALWELYGNVDEPGKNWLSRAAIGLMLGALVIWAVTGVSLISDIDDSTGSRLVLLTSLVTLVAIAGGVFFYWRADRALAAAMPRPAKVSVQREIAPAAAASLALEDVELSEWDSWPERDAGKQEVPDSDAEKPGAPASFEPEVAAEAVEEIDTADSDSGAETDEPDAKAVQDTSEKTVQVEPVAEGAEPAAELPSNVRPLRLPATIGSAEPEEADDVLIAESVQVVKAEAVGDEAPPEDLEEVDETVGEIVEEPWPDEVNDDEAQDAPESEKDNGEPGAFESSLLADVDGSLADQDGGYRSPLLSDLGADKLEGVGLAKWRPDARLTEQEKEEAPPPAKRSRSG